MSCRSRRRGRWTGTGSRRDDASIRSVAIVAARRTPIGTAGHGLATSTAADLAAAVLPPVLADAGLTADDVAEVVLGNCTGPGGDLARFAALQAGLGVGVPGLTVDRQCGSGLAALVVGAALVEDGRVVIAGGVESRVDLVAAGTGAVRTSRAGDPSWGIPRWGRPPISWPPGPGSAGTGRTRTPCAPTSAPWPPPSAGRTTPSSSRSAG